MSSHRNADGSVSNGIKDEPPGIFIAARQNERDAAFRKHFLGFDEE
jgi:hypothetical protein